MHSLCPSFPDNSPLVAQPPNSGPPAVNLLAHWRLQPVGHRLVVRWASVDPPVAISLVVVSETAMHCGIEVDKQNSWREPGSVFAIK